MNSHYIPPLLVCLCRCLFFSLYLGIVLLWPSLTFHPSHERAGSDPSSITGLKSQTAVHPSLAYQYESSDSEADRPDPDVVLDDLASRRFHSPSPVAPTNFALPMSHPEATAVQCTTRSQVAVSNVSQQTLTHLRSELASLTCICLPFYQC